jgi:hypothetical protein
VIDCAAGRPIAELAAPPGRHFYGHGAFSPDGRQLYTPENDYEAGDGRIGIWAADGGYARIGEFRSHGTGPHDAALLPGTGTLVVANGGIATHPDSGRTPLNLATMRPSLAYVDLSGRLLERVELAPELHLNSIRHLALRGDGLVAFAMQWQGDAAARPPLLALHRRGEAPALLAAPEPQHARMQNYAGSVAFSGDAASVAISSPQGGQVHVFDATTGAFARAFDAPDVCGLAACGPGFMASTGTGEIAFFGAPTRRARRGTR